MAKEKKILFADLDGTLIETISGETFPKGIWDMKFKFDVLDAIKRMNPKMILIASNQGGIELGYITESEFKAKLEYICKSIEDYCMIPCYGTYCKDNRVTCPNRKPNLGMLQSLSRAFLESNLEDVVDDSLMIGDASGLPGQFSDSDKRTAENCGMEYMDVQDFCKQYSVTNAMTSEEERLFNEYLKAEELEKQPLTDAQKKCNHKWYKTWAWHSGGFQKCVLCGRVETFYERD